MIRPAAAMSAALLFAFAPLVWSQALVAEVYSLNLLAVSIFLLVWSRRGANAFSGFWLGLAITTHLTSVFWLPAMVIRGRRRWLRIGAGMALGLSPLLLLPWLASRNSPIVWGQPVDPTGWWWLVSGRIYNANIQPTVNVGRWLALLQAIALGPAAVLASSAGDDPRSRPATDDTRPTPLLFIGTSLLYVAFVLFYDTPDAAVLLLPAFLILALLAAPLLERFDAFVWLLPIALVALTFGVRDLRGQKPEQPPRVLAEGILRSAPENALLLTPGDRTIFTLLYFQQVEGARSDLRLADANLFAFDWYRIRLRERYPDVSIPVEDDLEALWRENGSSRPFCLVGLVEPPPEVFIMAAAGRLERGTGAPWLSCVEEMD